MILHIIAKFQLSSKIRSVSRTPCQQSPYLVDVDGSWWVTWLTGSYSYLTSWLFIWDLQELTLKLLFQYLLIWRSYKENEPNIQNSIHLVHCVFLVFYFLFSAKILSKQTFIYKKGHSCMDGTFYVSNTHQNCLIDISLDYAWVFVFEKFMNLLKNLSFFNHW